mmetsp:Transcript_31557/g.80880  ORF Transcript_31557/g.80880 Transcript_31557/m.80880 type:complete len:304 (-) Transcript_31557:229-1140(-)
MEPSFRPSNPGRSSFLSRLSFFFWILASARRLRLSFRFFCVASFFSVSFRVRSCHASRDLAFCLVSFFRLRRSSLGSSSTRSPCALARADFHASLAASSLPSLVPAIAAAFSFFAVACARSSPVEGFFPRLRTFCPRPLSGSWTLPNVRSASGCGLPPGPPCRAALPLAGAAPVPLPGLARGDLAPRVAAFCHSFALSAPLARSSAFRCFRSSCSRAASLAFKVSREALPAPTLNCRLTCFPPWPSAGAPSGAAPAASRCTSSAVLAWSGSSLVFFAALAASLAALLAAARSALGRNLLAAPS